LINQAHLTDQSDAIHWRFTADGNYSTKSAYDAQFAGSYPDFKWKQLWHAKVENKCKFYSWLLVQNKLWTADRLNKYGGDVNPICQLCCTQPESALHMIAQFSYSRSVWLTLSSWMGTDLHAPPSTNFRRFQSWWSAMLSSGIHGTAEDDLHGLESLEGTPSSSF
jgi:hypothetical protein